jgi:hypothetical protein
MITAMRTEPRATMPTAYIDGGAPPWLLRQRLLSHRQRPESWESATLPMSEQPLPKSLVVDWSSYGSTRRQPSRPDLRVGDDASNESARPRALLCSEVN